MCYTLVNINTPAPTGLTYSCWKNWLHENFSAGSWFFSGLPQLLGNEFSPTALCPPKLFYTELFIPSGSPYPTSHWASESSPSSDGCHSKSLNDPNHLPSRIPWSLRLVNHWEKPRVGCRDSSFGKVPAVPAWGLEFNPRDLHRNSVWLCVSTAGKLETGKSQGSQTSQTNKRPCL